MSKKPERLGDAPIEQLYREQMKALAGAIDEVFNPTTRGAERKTAFVLLVFPFGDHDDSRCNFISNGADRKDLVCLFREMIARFEGQPEMKGTA